MQNDLYLKKDGKFYSSLELDMNIFAYDKWCPIQQIFEKRNGLWIEVWAGNIQIASGTIVMFEGAEADIPEGWAFCDGTNGTPDLRDRFIYGSTSCGTISGSSSSHSHTLGSDTHSHSLSYATHTHNKGTLDRDYDTDAYGGQTDAQGGHSHPTDSYTHSHTISSSAYVIPPYYILAFIMKL